MDDISDKRTLGRRAEGQARSEGRPALMGVADAPGSRADAPWTLQGGAELGGYRVVRPLGRGGMGEVYLVRHERMGKLYAMKLISPDRASDTEFPRPLGQAEPPKEPDLWRRRFTLEARLMADLDHPGIVRVHNMGEENGRYFLVMDYIEGRDGGPSTLAALLRGKSRLPETEARRIALEIARALAHAHSFGEGVVHRDLKPGNVLIDGEGRARVTDFGLARVMGDDYAKSVLERSVGASVTGTTAPGGGLSQSDGAILGTVAYMAPEQKEGRADARSDIFALGLILYRMLTGERAEGAFAMPSELGCAAAWDSVVRRALAPRPEKRYQSAAEMIADIELPAAKPGRTAPSAAVVGIAAAVIVTVGILGALVWFANADYPPPVQPPPAPKPPVQQPPSPRPPTPKPLTPRQEDAAAWRKAEADAKALAAKGEYVAALAVIKRFLDAAKTDTFKPHAVGLHGEIDQERVESAKASDAAGGPTF